MGSRTRRLKAEASSARHSVERWIEIVQSLQELAKVDETFAALVEPALDRAQDRLDIAAQEYQAAADRALAGGVTRAHGHSLLVPPYGLDRAGVNPSVGRDETSELEEPYSHGIEDVMGTVLANDGEFFPR